MQTAAPFAIFPHNVTTTSPLPDPPDVKLKKGRSFAKHPVVFVSVNVTGQLKLRETHSCANGLFRQRLWGGTFGELHKNLIQADTKGNPSTSTLDKMTSQYNLLSQLTPHEHSGKILAVVNRTWEVDTTTTRTFDFILMDPNGNQIHGWVAKSLAAKFQPYMYEGAIVNIDNFRVLEKRLKYFSPVKHRFHIELRDDSHIQVVSNHIAFPPPTFDFTEFADLNKRINDDSYLTDVIGIFRRTSAIQTIAGKNSQKIDIFIENESGHTLKITFWNQTISSIPSALTSSSGKRILIVTSTSVKEYNSVIFLKSTMATKVYLDMDVPQVHNFRNKLLTQKRRLPAEDKIRTVEYIQSQLEQKKEGDYTCCATITKVHDELEWCYTACPSCLKKIKSTEYTNNCTSCNHNFSEPTVRYILQLEIEDNTGELQITVFGNEATQLLSTPVHEMIRIQTSQGNNAVSAHLKTLLNKQHLFHIKITNYNIRFPTRPLTVAAIFDPNIKQEKKMRVLGESSKG